MDEAQAPHAQSAPHRPAPDDISGTSGSDTLFGTAGVDKILADAGDDFLYGKGGSRPADRGAGKDKFVFDTKFDGTIDEILDFNPLDDIFYLDNAIFTKFGRVARQSQGGSIAPTLRTVPVPSPMTPTIS